MPGGFTLLEVLVAFVILTIALTALLRVFSGGLNAIEIAQRHATATMLARSVIERTGIETPLAEGEQSGLFGDGFAWTARVARSTLVDPIGDAGVLQVPYEIVVTVAWEGSPVLTLRTLRLASEVDTRGEGFEGREDEDGRGGESSP